MKQTSIFALAALALFCCACGTPKYIPVETVHTEYRNNYLRDSIYFRDSIFQKVSGDTVFYQKFHYLYRDKIIRDSIFKTDTIQVPFPVEVIKEKKARLSGWQNFQVWCGRLFLLFALLTIGIIIRRLFKK